MKLKDCQKGDLVKIESNVYEILTDITPASKTIRVIDASDNIRRITPNKDVELMIEETIPVAEQENIVEKPKVPKAPILELKDTSKETVTDVLKPKSKASEVPSLTPEDRYLSKTKPTGFFAGKTWKEVIEEFAEKFMSGEMWLVYKPESEAYRLWKEEMKDKEDTPYGYMNHSYSSKTLEETAKTVKDLSELNNGYFYMYKQNGVRAVGDYIGKKALPLLISKIS